MSGWVILAALAAVAITAMLTWVLYRLNERQPDRRGADGDGGPVIYGGLGADRHDDNGGAGGDAGGSGEGGGGGD
jgi:hypothetical protein